MDVVTGRKVPIVYQRSLFFYNSAFGLRYALSLATLALVSVLLITEPARAKGSNDKPQSSGTGFIVSRQGHVLTNHHVVEDCPSVRVIAEGLQTETTIVGLDKENDLAIIKLSKPFPTVARFRKGRNIRAGDNIVVVGFPYHSLLASEANVTTGAVSALAGIRNDTRFLQIAAPVQPGNSGGPVLDKSGNVVGIVQSKLNALAMALMAGDIPQNVNFAIKDAIAKSFLESQGVLYETALSDKQLDPAEIGESAKQFTLLIECYAETVTAKKQRLEAERRAMAELKRKQDAAHEQARMLENEERLRIARLIEAERQAAEQEEYQRKKELAEKQATEKRAANELAAKEAEEMRAASQRVARFHEEERAQERMDKARQKGQRVRAQAALKSDEPGRRALDEARRRAVNADPRFLEDARRKGQEAHGPLPLMSEELNRELDEALTKVRHFRRVTPLKPLDSSKTNPFWARVEAIIRSHWAPPPTKSSDQPNSVTVQFRVLRNGTINGVAIKESSGNRLFDQAAERAVLTPRQIPPFPAGIAEPYQDVEMVFAVLGKPALATTKAFKLTESDTFYRHSLAPTPSSAFNLAYNDYLLGNYELAAAGFQWFMKEFPGTTLVPDAYYLLGESYYYQKNYRQAMQAFEYVVSQFSGAEKMPGALFKLGLAAAETGDMATSQKSLKRLIREFPASDEAGLAKVRFADLR